MKKETAINKLRDKGIAVVPVEGKELTDTLLSDAAGLAEQGATVSELNETLGTSVFEALPEKGDPAPAPAPTAAPAPAQSVAEPGMITMSEAMLRSLVESAAKAAVEGVRMQQQPQAAQQPVVVYEKPNKKPLYPTKAAVPAEFWSNEKLVVYHAGNHHTMDGFMVEGRYEECPRSVLLLFTSTQAYNSKRFGDATQIIFICKYETHDKREIELFKKDIRWGSEYWDGSGRSKSMDADVEMSMLVAQNIQSLASLGFENLRARCINEGIEISDIRRMAAELAIKAARRHFMKQQQMAQDRTDAALKQGLLAGDGDRRHIANMQRTNLEEESAAAAR